MISPPAHFHGLLPISSPPSSSSSSSSPSSSSSSSSSSLGHGSFNGSLCLPRPRALAEPSSFHLPLSSPASSSGSASVSSARERRKQKNERREQRKAEEGSSWKAVIDERLTEKKKGGSPKPGLQYELDMTSRLTSRGMQWWMVLVSARFELEMADSITKALKLEFPENEFEVFVPVVPSKRKMKDGSFSPSTKVLHSGCVFLRTVMSRRVHDIVKKVPRCRGFFGKKVGYLEQVTMPTPIPPEDMDGMLKKVREEEEDFERLKNIAKQEREMMQAAKEAEKTKEAPVEVATVGSNVRIRNGPFVNFEGFISDLTDDKKVEVSISAFGDIQKVSLTLEDLELTSS